MSYKKPDVFVAIELGQVSPTVNSPELEAVIVGPHYFVAAKSVSESAFYSGAALTAISYPGIPKQTVAPANDLQVDIDNQDFSPRVWIRTEDGVDVEITSATGVVIAAASLTIPATLKYDKATGLWSSGGADALTGQVVASYRALEEKYTGNNTVLLEAGSVEDLVALFGTNGYAQANPLGFGMYNAILRGQTAVKGVAVGNPASDNGSSVYGTGEITDDLVAHQVAATFLETSAVYVIVPLTFAQSVREMWKAHCDEQSKPEKRMHRIVICADNMDNKNVYYASNGEVCGLLQSATVSGVDGFAVGDKITINGNDAYVRLVEAMGDEAWVAFPETEVGTGLTFNLNDGADITDGEYTVPSTGLVVYGDGINFQAPGYRKAKVGDSVNIGAVPATALVASTPSPSTVKTGAITGTPVAGETTAFELYRYLTLDGLVTGNPDKAAEANRLKAMAEAYRDSRLTILAPGYVGFPIAGEYVDIESYYIACQLAGEIAATVPGYPIGVEPFVAGIESRTKTFKTSRYLTESQLDTAAGGGISLIVNSRIGGSLQLRHTLTTDRTSIEAQELMMQIARDAVAKTFQASLGYMPRRFRTGGQLQSVLPASLSGIKAVLTRRGIIQDIKFDKIAGDENAPDTVNVEMTLYHYYPMNNLVVTGKVSTPTSSLSINV